MPEPLRIAIVHYHLRRGGVTRVIESACRALRRHGVRVTVLTGEAAASPSPVDAPVCVIPALGYADAVDGGDDAVRDLERVARQDAAKALGGAPDVWHFHNAALGKNPRVTALADRLAREGCPLVLQSHDFAEDQRPREWHRLVEGLGGGEAAGLDDRLYPVGDHVCLAILNDRDRRMLAAAGAPPESLALLPNPVEAPVAASPAPRDDRPRLWLYPTRAIRRKNLGEMLLWAALAPDGDVFESTLEPTNPADRAIYADWVSLARTHRLPVAFGVGLAGTDAFEKRLHRAAGWMTTSIAEGFGLAFLESWCMDKPVHGRQLPEITRDMTAAGVDLSGLYAGLDVPLEWVGRDVLRERLGQGLSAMFRRYAISPPADAADQALTAICRGDGVDFGGLDEALQRGVVARVAASRATAGSLRPCAADGRAMTEGGDAEALFRTIFPSTPDRDVCARNRRVIEQHYAMAAYGDALMRCYASVLRGSGLRGHVPATAVLKQFLHPARFRLLRGGVG